MPVPQELRKELEKYPTILQFLIPVYDKPSLPVGYEPKVIDVYMDQRHAIQWVTGDRTHTMDCDDDYEPYTLEVFIDGELVCLIIGNDCLFERLKNGIELPNFNEVGCKR